MSLPSELIDTAAAAKPAAAGSVPPLASPYHAADAAAASHRLSRYQKWRLGLMIAGGFIAVAAMVAAIHQLATISEQIRRQADAAMAQNSQSELLTLALQVQTFQALSQTWAQIDTVFINKPYLRPYFYEGVVIAKDNQHYVEALGVAELVLDLFEAYRNADLALMKAFPASQLEYSAANANYIANTFEHSPLLCRRLAESADSYSLRLKEISRQPCSHPKK